MIVILSQLKVTLTLSVVDAIFFPLDIHRGKRYTVTDVVIIHCYWHRCINEI